MTNRSQAFIDRLAIWLWPVLRFLFRIDVMGTEHLPKGPALIVANHNSGALIESHSLVFLLNEQRIKAFGLNHQALFKIPLVGSYFRKIGAISAAREAAVEALQAGAPVLIFPGGNREAFRSFKEDSCCYGWGQGWSDIAVEQSVPVVVVKFSGTHGINPIYLSSEFLSRALLLPWLLKVRYFPLSLAQMLCATVGVLLSSALGLSPELVALVGYLGFVMTPLVPVLPRSVKIKIYPPLSPGQDFSHSAELREAVRGRMALRDIPSGPRVSYSLNGIEKFVLYNESAAVSYNSQFVFEFTGQLDRERIYATTRRWVTEIPYLRTAHTRGWWAPRRFSYRDAWFEPSDIVHFEAGLDQKKMDEFCGRRLNLAFEPGVRFLVQTDGERHRLIFSCHHSLFDGAAQAYVFEAWSRLYNGRDVPPAFTVLREFHFRSLASRYGIFEFVKQSLRNFSFKPPRSVMGVATFSDQIDRGCRKVTSRTIELPVELDSRPERGFDPIAVVIGAADEVLRRGGDSDRPLFVLFPTGLRWTLKIRDSLQNAVISMNVFIRRESLNNAEWSTKIHSRIAADPILSNRRFVFGALAATSFFSERQMRSQFELFDRSGGPETATLLFVRAPIPRTFPLPKSWNDIVISARGTLLRSPSVGVILTGQRGRETLTIEWVESLVSADRIDSLEAALRRRLSMTNHLSRSEMSPAVTSVSHPTLSADEIGL